MNALSVVLGAGSGLGAEIARQLLDQGHDVRGVTRSGQGIPPGAQNVRSNILDRRAAIDACRGAAVVHLAANVDYPQWLTTFPTMVDNAIAAAESAGAKLVFTDNLYAYGPVDGPITENTPERPAGPKEKLRSRLGRTLLDAHERGRLPVTIGRVSDYYGPDARISLPNELVIEPLARARNPLWFAPLDMPHTFGFSTDTAKALALLGNDPRADGKIWHTPAAETLTVREFIELAGRSSGRVRKPIRLPALTPKLMAIYDKRLRGYGELDHQRARPWIVDHSAFDATFGALALTDHEEAIERTLSWYRR